MHRTFTPVDRARFRLRYRNVVMAALAAAGLAGCANSATENASVAISAAHLKGNEELAKSRFVAPDAPTGPLRTHDSIYLAGETRERDHGVGLPSALAKRSFTFVDQQPRTFRQVADLITRVTRIPVVSRDGDVGPSSAALTRAGASDIAGSESVAKGPQPPGYDVQRAVDMAKAAASGQATQALTGALPATAGQGEMSVNFTGRLGDFLDLVGDNFNYSWEYSDGRISFARTEVVTYDIPALPIIMKLAFTLDSGAQSGGAGGSGGGIQQSGGSSQKAGTEAAFNLWSDIEKTLKDIVGTSGTLDISGSTGTVTANVPNTVKKQLARYITRINRELSREIVMQVDVFSVRLNQADNYNLNLNLALSQGATIGGGVATAGAAALSTATSSSTLGTVLSSANATNNALGVSVIGAGKQLSGSNAIIEALSTQGDVSVVNSASLTTLNGIPAPFQVVNTRGYVAAVSTTLGSSVAASGAVQTSLTPGTVTTGFNLYVVPRVDKNGTVLLQYGVNISELVGATNGFDTFTSGGQTVQLPNINARNFVQEASVPVNGTLVLTGFESKQDQNNASGAGDAFFPILGGGRNSAHGREVVVISITPRVVSFGQKTAIQ